MTWVLLLIVVCAGSRAAPITFLHSGSGSGTLAGTPFATSAFVITATGDTASRVDNGNSFYIPHLIAQIDIAGLGVFQFLSGTRTFVSNSSGLVGFSRFGEPIIDADLFNGPGGNPVLAAWNMLTPIGPFSGLGDLGQWPADLVNGTYGDVVTNGGVLVFAQSSSPWSFAADVVEPGSLLLLAVGLVGLGFGRRKR